MSSSKPPDAPKPDGSGAAPHHQLQVVPVSAELIEAAALDRATININVLLANVTRTENPDDALANAEKALDLAKKWEDHNLRVLKERSQAMIEVKEKDPDEIDKRRSNRTRRQLKYVIAGGGAAGFAGMVTTVLVGGPVLVATLSGLIGAVCFGTLAPLASGESVSSTDVVRVITAIVTGLRGGEDHTEKPGQQQHDRGGKKGKRR